MSKPEYIERKYLIYIQPELSRIIRVIDKYRGNVDDALECIFYLVCAVEDGLDEGELYEYLYELYGYDSEGDPTDFAMEDDDIREILQTADNIYWEHGPMLRSEVKHMQEDPRIRLYHAQAHHVERTGYVKVTIEYEQVSWRDVEREAAGANSYRAWHP